MAFVATLVVRVMTTLPENVGLNVSKTGVIFKLYEDGTVSLGSKYPEAIDTAKKRLLTNLTIQSLLSMLADTLETVGTVENGIGEIIVPYTALYNTH